MINNTWLSTWDADDKDTKSVPDPQFAEKSASAVMVGWLLMRRIFQSIWEV